MDFAVKDIRYVLEMCSQNAASMSCNHIQMNFLFFKKRTVALTAQETKKQNCHSSCIEGTVAFGKIC